jgi:hypothetical protein
MIGYIWVFLILLAYTYIGISVINELRNDKTN